MTSGFGSQGRPDLSSLLQAYGNNERRDAAIARLRQLLRKYFDNAIELIEIGDNNYAVVVGCCQPEWQGCYPNGAPSDDSDSM